MKGIEIFLGTNPAELTKIRTDEIIERITWFTVDS